MVKAGNNKVFTAKFEASGTPEKNNFMSEEVNTEEVPVPVMKTSPPKDNIAKYKNVKTREQFRDPLEELELKGQLSLEAAAARAEHKRAHHTGLPRGLPSKKALGSA